MGWPAGRADPAERRVEEIFANAPSLDGRLLLDLPSRTIAARDAGGLVSKMPSAVMRPRSIEDVVRMVRFCGPRGIAIAARGQGHTTFGQAQTRGGLVIDLSTLDVLHELEDDHAVADAGMTWRRLLVAAAGRGRTPPVLTGFQGLSIGGTLSVGGISGMAYDKGAQVDHVLELQVVTGGGQLLTCSPHTAPELFDAVLAGLGRCGIIVRATVRLVPLGSRVRHHIVRHRDLGPFMRDLRALAVRGTLDGLSGTISLDIDREPCFDINAVKFFAEPDQPDTASLLRDLDPEGTMKVIDRDTVDHHLLVDRLIEELQDAGQWEGVARPWFDVFLPDRHVDGYVERVLADLNPAEDVGPKALGALGQIHLFPLWTRHLRRPLLRVPDGELVFLFDILTSAYAPGPNAVYAARMIERNQRLFDDARRLGGTRYRDRRHPLFRGLVEPRSGSCPCSVRRTEAPPRPSRDHGL